VLKRLSRIALVLSLVCVVGGHWAVLQSLAWLGMTVTFSRTDRLDVAIEKTFGGQHPCNLCHFVAEGKKSERTKQIVKAETRLDLISSPCFILPTPTEHSIELTGFLVTGCLRLEAPPSPPPRLA
jgi:hypothetical protein